MLKSILLTLLAFAVIPAAMATETCYLAKAGVAPTATITFTPPTKNTDGTTITGTLTYDLYMGTASGAEKVVAVGLTGTPITYDANLTDGTTYYFYVTALNSAGNASAPSNEACITFPAATPDTVVITIT